MLLEIFLGDLFLLKMTDFWPEYVRKNFWQSGNTDSIPACHAGDRGSIPRQRGIYFLFFQILKYNQTRYTK